MEHNQKLKDKENPKALGQMASGRGDQSAPGWLELGTGKGDLK